MMTAKEDASIRMLCESGPVEYENMLRLIRVRCPQHIAPCDFAASVQRERIQGAHTDDIAAARAVRTLLKVKSP